LLGHSTLETFLDSKLITFSVPESDRAKRLESISVVCAVMFVKAVAELAVRANVKVPKSSS